MSQHVPETCNGSSGTWLPLTEYFVKSGVSLSTIRRKIKSNSIPYRLENGRYLILFQGNGAKQDALCRNVQEPKKGPTKVIRPPQERLSVAVKEPGDQPFDTLPLVEKSVAMVSDAFEHALKEKDKRIRLLEKRNADLQERLDELRLLVQVLEEKYEVRY